MNGPTYNSSIISINPRHVDNILAGTKTVELRKKFSKQVAKGSTLWIYKTAPDSAIVGRCEIDFVFRGKSWEVWKRYSSVACVGMEEFVLYYGKGEADAVAIGLRNVRTFERPVPLSYLRREFGFTAPQSYCHAKRDIEAALRAEALEEFCSEVET